MRTKVACAIITVTKPLVIADDLQAEAVLFKGKLGSYTALKHGKQCYSKNLWNIVQKTLPNTNVVTFVKTFVKSPVTVIHAILRNKKVGYSKHIKMADLQSKQFCSMFI